MYSIGEFSKISGLPVKTLRFYHERGLLDPAAVDPETGYRYYDERNLETAFVIRTLRQFEFSLDDIATILEQCGDDCDVVDYLEKQKLAIAELLTHYQELTSTIDQVIHFQRESRKAASISQRTCEIEERQVEPLLVAGLRMKGKYSDCGQGFSKLGKKLGRYIAGKPLCLYYDGEYREEDADFEPCFPLRKAIESDDFNIRTLPAARCIVLVHQGPYDTLGRSYARLLDYAKEQGYEIDVPTREVYVKGPGMIFKGNPKKYLTEIQLPIRE